MASQSEIELLSVLDLLRARGWVIEVSTVSPGGLFVQARRAPVVEPLAGRPLRTLGPEDLQGR